MPLRGTSPSRDALQSPRPRLPAVRELACLALTGAVLVAAFGLPAIPQDPAYHRFADQRAWLGIPRAADVLTSFAFLVVGAAGLARLQSAHRERFARATEAGLWCIATSLALTGLGSAWYHLEPNDATLTFDRLPMTLGFAGVLGVAISQRVGTRVAAAALPLVVAFGLASIFVWRATGNLTPYVVLQFGAALGVVLIAAVTRAGNDPFPWRWVIGGYALAKAFELADVAVFDATGGLVAGHTLKHVAAATAAAAALRPLFRAAPGTPRDERGLSRPT